MTYGPQESKSKAPGERAEDGEFILGVGQGFDGTKATSPRLGRLGLTGEVTAAA